MSDYKIVKTTISPDSKLTSMLWDSIDRKELITLFNTFVHYGIRRKHIYEVLVESIKVNMCDYNICIALKSHINKLIPCTYKNRGECRAMDFKKLVRRANKKITKYLDIGAHDGLITCAIANALNVQPKCVFGADVESWIGSSNTVDKSVTNQIHSVGIKAINNKTHIPLAGGFSLISALQTLHHVEDIDGLMSEITRLLIPGGLFIIREHNCKTKNIERLIHLEHCLYSVLGDNTPKDTFMNNYYGRYLSAGQWDCVMESYGFKCLFKQFKNNVTQYYYAVYEKLDTSPPPTPTPSPIGPSGRYSQSPWRLPFSKLNLDTPKI
jgi:2-polyprenyl-3-methyl-5-hydroxy-6-metoxy-1,4-benzoquinol methylase